MWALPTLKSIFHTQNVIQLISAIYIWASFKCESSIYVCLARQRQTFDIFSMECISNYYYYLILFWNWQDSNFILCTFLWKQFSTFLCVEKCFIFLTKRHKERWKWRHLQMFRLFIYFCSKGLVIYLLFLQLLLKRALCLKQILALKCTLIGSK